MHMRRIMLAAAMAAGLTAAALARPVSYDLPEETAELAPGPGLEIAQANCVACHSADYIATQPRTLRDPAAFWTAEVNKMRHSYGASVEDSDVKAIVDYLVATYGR
jgi:sulfite dehydrogenase (cytochrome) subunit B